MGPGNSRSSRRFCDDGLGQGVNGLKGSLSSSSYYYCGIYLCEYRWVFTVMYTCVRNAYPYKGARFRPFKCSPHPWGSELPPPPPPTVWEFISGCRAVRYRDARAPVLIEFNSFRGGPYIHCERTPPRPILNARMVDRKSPGNRWNNRKNRTTRKPTRHPGIEKTKSAITRNRIIRNRFPGFFNRTVRWLVPKSFESYASWSDRYE